jgi:hypothetical protein
MAAPCLRHTPTCTGKPRRYRNHAGASGHRALIWIMDFGANPVVCAVMRDNRGGQRDVPLLIGCFAAGAYASACGIRSATSRARFEQHGGARTTAPARFSRGKVKSFGSGKTVQMRIMSRNLSAPGSPARIAGGRSRA